MWRLGNKITVSDSGLFEGFRDCHCHLLPGVDDGVQKVEVSLSILRLWEQAGVKEVWLTPHVMEDIPNTSIDLTRCFEAFKMAYNGPIRLHLASENMMDQLFMDRLQNGDLLTLGQSGNRLLVETSYYNPPMDLEKMMDRIRERGYTPVLAHPERYQYMDMIDYKKWKEEGVLFQLNVPSLVGAYGLMVQKKAEILLDKGLYDCCGTDMHSMEAAEYFLDGRIRKKAVKAVRQLAETQL